LVTITTTAITETVAYLELEIRTITKTTMGIPVYSEVRTITPTITL
jgi:hypothetical protein